MAPRTSAAISPTAHYTGEVWRRNGLGDDALGTWEGRLLHAGLRPAMALSGALGGATLEGFLLARHRLIDGILEAAIGAGRIGRVIEIAAGMSPRGVRFSSRNPELEYIEADLPAMAARKRTALDRIRAGTPGDRHRVVDLDALAEDGPLSLRTLVAGLEPGIGTAIVTEGLLNYFPRGQVEGLWCRIAAALREVPEGLYVSDIHLAGDATGTIDRAFAAGLSLFVRGRIHLHFRDPEAARAALTRAGFGSVVLHSGREGGSAPGAERVHVIDVWR